MNVPSGYTALDLIGFTDKGDYSASATYVQNDIVSYNNRKWRCKIDDTSAVTPTEGANWTLFMESASSFAGMTDVDITSPSAGQIPVYDATSNTWKNVSPDSSPANGSAKPVTSGGVYTALQGKQNTLTFDNAPTQNSDNPVKSGGVYTALQGKQDTLTIDSAPASGSSNPVSSNGVYNALSGKQNTLTFDSAPTSGSDNPVKSGGVYTALQGKQNTLTFDNAPTQNSDNPVKSGGIYTSVKAVSDALSALGLSVVNGKLCVTFTE